MNANPWQVDSIEAFSCLKCPECNFYSRDENYFKDHAMANHPCSVVFFGNPCEKFHNQPDRSINQGQNGNGVFGDTIEVETEVQQSWEIQNSLSKQELQSQTQFNMIDNRFQHNNHSDLLNIHTEGQDEQSHYMPNQDENGHFMLENGPWKPFVAPNLPAGNTQQQIENQQKTNLQGISLQSEQSNSALVKVQILIYAAYFKIQVLTRA